MSVDNDLYFKEVEGRLSDIERKVIESRRHFTKDSFVSTTFGTLVGIAIALATVLWWGGEQLRRVEKLEESRAEQKSAFEQQSLELSAIRSEISGIELKLSRLIEDLETNLKRTKEDMEISIQGSRNNANEKIVLLESNVRLSRCREEELKRLVRSTLAVVKAFETALKTGWNPQDTGAGSNSRIEDYVENLRFEIDTWKCS